MKSLRNRTLRLAYEKPELRPVLLPLVSGRTAGRMNDIAVAVVEDFLRTFRLLARERKLSLSEAGLSSGALEELADQFVAETGGRYTTAYLRRYVETLLDSVSPA